jgi:hypothetical protein
MVEYNRVRAGAKYRFNPVPWDRLDPPYGVNNGTLATGDSVRVVNLPGCPKANVMGHCHIETVAGEFAGLVCTNSLERE